MQKHWKILE